METKQVWEKGLDILVQTDVHIPWSQLLGEDETNSPENDTVSVMPEDIVGGAEGLVVGQQVTLNTDPDNWHGVDGGCQRTTCWLNGKSGKVVGFDGTIRIQE